MLRDWKVQISIDRRKAMPLTVQITQAIVDKIRSGLLRPGEALPGSRELAAVLGINRKTVITAYDELTSHGWLSVEGKRGTFVSPELPEVKVEQRSRTMRRALGTTGLRGPDYAVYGIERELPEPAPKGTIEFTDGVPDTRVIEFNAISAAFRLALIESARGNQMGYGDPRGFLMLRSQIASMLRHERGLNADENTLCVVRGSQMGIFLAARILVRPGDIVAMEMLTYPAARDAFRACGATVVGIEQDEQGVIPASLEKLCRRHRIKAIYLTPHHQFPTTVTLTADRRLRLLALAEQFGFAIVEDDYDHEFHFSGNPMLPMASIDRFGKVIYIGSLSKVLAPGLRIGYIVAPATVINRVAYEITLIDRQGNTVAERAAAELMNNGELKRHIRRALKIYQARRDLLMQLVTEKLGHVVRLQRPDGGLALWLRLDESIDMIRLERDAREERLQYLAGDRFHDKPGPVHAMRLGYGGLNDQEMRLGITRLASALARQTDARPRS